MPQARGTFSVQLTPAVDDYLAQTPINRLTLTKQFEGDLQANSTGEMLSSMGMHPESAGYVVIEQVRGSLEGKEGTFVLQHYGIMNRAKSLLYLTVIPDSGTGDLQGLSGSMNIIVDNGEHRYEFDYGFHTSIS
jgi:hypothetical protein